MQHPPSSPSAPRSFLREYAGVGIVLAVAGVLELLRAKGLTVPNPPALLIMALTYVAYSRGVRPGLVAAALSWLYVGWHFSAPGLPFRFSDENLTRVLIWAVTMPAMALLVGVLHDRAVRAAVSAEERRHAAAIDRTEENRRLIVEHALDAVVTMDSRGVIIDWNPAAAETFGRAREDAVGKQFADVVLPDLARTEFNDRLSLLRQTKDPERFRDRFEAFALRRDAVEFPIEISLFALRANGDFASCAVVRDISERRISERRHEVMMRELDHRVKNNLAAVLSIVDQTASRSANLQEFMINFRGRVMAMARLHSSLAASRWSGAELQSLVRQTLEPYTQRTEGRVVIRGGPVTLPASAVSSVCMALHELATNASRYGALSVPEGRVLVEWKVDPASEGKDHLRLLWTEEGGPPVDAPSRYGFGRQLIEEGVRYEAGGRTHLSFSPTGVTCELVVPLSIATAAAAK